MAKHGWSILCSRSIVDSATNQVSLIDAVDQFEINTPEIDEMLQEALSSGNQGLLIPAQLTLATWWYRAEKETPERASARLRMLNPGDQVVVEQPFAVPLETSSVHRTFFAVPALKFSGYGRYQFLIEQQLDTESGWLEVARLPLDVRKNVNADGAAEPASPRDPAIPAPTT